MQSGEGASSSAKGISKNLSGDFLENGDPNGIRTRVTPVKGECPRPLDDRVKKKSFVL